MATRHGKGLLPVRIRASQPVFLSSVAMKLDDSESPMQPVRGDFVRTANLLDVVRRVPTSGLPTKINGLAGSNGSTPAGQEVYSRYVPRPLPPMKWRSTLASRVSQVVR